MSYEPKSPVSKEISKLMGHINTAQLQWNSYATQLGRGYTVAYEEHEKAIKDIDEKYRLAAESAYWVLSLLCVTHAGGLVGGLMAPWVNRAGERGAAKVATTISETFQSMTQSGVQRGLDAAKKQDEQSFRPATKSPLLYWQDLLGELGICFARLRLGVEDYMKAVDQTHAEGYHMENPAHFITRFLATPLLRDYPRTMPDEKKIAKEAELGMWIAWANVRDVDYWKTRIDTVSSTDSPRRKWGIHIDELRRLQAVVDRLKALDATALGTKTVDRPMLVGSKKETILDITRLRIAGALLAVVPGTASFLTRVADVVKDPRKTLAELESTAPRHAARA